MIYSLMHRSSDPLGSLLEGLQATAEEKARAAADVTADSLLKAAFCEPAAHQDARPLWRQVRCAVYRLQGMPDSHNRSGVHPQP